jgi:WD40 repeat protein
MDQRSRPAAGLSGFVPTSRSTYSTSPDGRYLAATLGDRNGLRIFDRDKDWTAVFRDDQYGGDSYGATFSADGRLVTTSFDGLIRRYAYEATSDHPNFRRVGEPLKAPSGDRPRGIAFSRDGTKVAVGYRDVAAVDILDGATLEHLGGHRPADARASPAGFAEVAWSDDCQTLVAVGAVADPQGRALLFAWDGAGLGDERRMTYCAPDTGSGLNILPNSRILVAAMMPCLGLMEAEGKPVWTVTSPVLDPRDQTDFMRVAQDGSVVDFGYRGSAGTVFRFDLRLLTLSSPAPSDNLTFPPSREGLTVDGWRNGTRPTLGGQDLPLAYLEIAESLAMAPDAKRFFLGSSQVLAAFDAAGTRKWFRAGHGLVWAVNASRDGRIVVAAHTDGTIRWYRADDGRELLALQVLLNKSEPSRSDRVLWTPEGFYEATPGAQEVLRWVVNHGPEKAATTLPVSAIPKLHRPGALPHVLDALETAHALGVEDISVARLEVQAKTGSAKPLGGVLHVLAVGIDNFGDKAAGLHLDYAAEDAHDVASALQDSQQMAPGKPDLYADVKVTYLRNDEASNTAIRDALDDMAGSMKTGNPDQDVAVILISSHGELIDGQFYLVPYGVDIGSKNKIIASALSASDFAKQVQDIAKRGKVLLLLDSCNSGAVGPGGWATDPDAKVLRDAMNMENVTVLTSSDKKGLSEELPNWRHGALAQAFLDSLTGAADGDGIVRLTALTATMDNELQSLTHRRQSLGMHVNFGGHLFVGSQLR